MVRGVQECLGEVFDRIRLGVRHWTSDMYKYQVICLLPFGEQRHLEMTIFDLCPYDMAKWRDNLGPFS